MPNCNQSVHNKPHIIKTSWIYNTFLIAILQVVCKHCRALYAILLTIATFCWTLMYCNKATFFHIALRLNIMLRYSTVKVFLEWNQFSKEWNVFPCVIHLLHAWIIVTRACEGKLWSISGANGSQMEKRHFLEDWFHERITFTSWVWNFVQL